MDVHGFDWDSNNRHKNDVKHGLSRETIEAFFSGKIFVAPDLKHFSDEDRFLAVGRGPKGRPMIVAFTFRVTQGARYIRPISARFMHAKEAKKYEEAFTQDEN